jgi:hypothetical protein
MHTWFIEHLFGLVSSAFGFGIDYFGERIDSQEQSSIAYARQNLDSERQCWTSTVEIVCVALTREQPKGDAVLRGDLIETDGKLDHLIA